MANKQRKLKDLRIFIEPKRLKALTAETDSVPSTVYQALNYSSHSTKSIEIRKLAYERYGGVIVETYERPMTADDIELNLTNLSQR